MKTADDITADEDLHDRLFGDAMDALNALFSNTDVPRAATREALEHLAVEIRSMIDALDNDDALEE